MKQLFSIYLFLMSIILVSCQVHSQEVKNESLEFELNQLIQQEFEEGKFEGTITIGNYDEIIFQRAIGVADRSWEIPMSMNVRFDIASVNKSFIAGLTLKAVEEGLLSLGDKLVNILKELEIVYTGSFSDSITIHQMLSHTSGLPDYNAVPEELSENFFINFKRKRFSNTEYVDFISKLPVVGKPKEKFYYSNFAYHLLPILLEELYNKSFSELLIEKITEPLQLASTRAYTQNEEIQDSLATAYNYQEKSGRWYENDFIDLSLGRRIFSTSTDLYKWGLAMDDTTFLSHSSLKLMKTNHLKEVSNSLSYGYGWVVFDGKGNYEMGKLPIAKKYIIHGGNTGGYKAMLVNINSGEWVISFLSNIGSRTNELQLAEKIVQLLNKQSDES
ncbi:serine hydrolase domain-containing protein [Sediminitomix flava]|uniref:CubicO group peptidase (Beta-lactamase class C family) n=1 Tax=Sediminitomix flava TaxID=379075 RepID=A0A315Z7P2_SEDFL|nr:serine hydrolase domain-containing protein [Sediminitomix flava]PWJ39945.1 CubicO group peptidase (beta-lactamase class C family) [Sediminitomix flava]